MSKIGSAISEIYRIDTLAARNQWMNRLHPLVKLMLTIFYIFTLVSFSKYNLMGLLSMVVYPIIGFLLADLSIKECIYRLRIVLPLVCAVGLANPFFDRTPLSLGQLIIPAGLISMVTLMLKGCLAVIASYLLIATTTIEKLCYALRLLHVPKILVTQIMLTYRYITVLLDEVNRITQAYALRAPGQKGVHIKAWGTLAGQLLLRSIDRADNLYESMTLRGYRGEFAYLSEKSPFRLGDLIYLLGWTVAFVLLRQVPVLLLLGQIFI